MAATDQLRKNLDATPLYALVGAADVAVSGVRDALTRVGERAGSVLTELSPKNVQTRISGAVVDVRDQALSLPSLATQRYEAVTGDLENSYNELSDGYIEFAERGEKVIGDLRRQPVAQKLSSRVDGAVDQSRSAVKSARKTARDTQETAVSTAFAARKEAAKGVAGLAGRVGSQAGKVEAEATTAVHSNAAKEGAAKPAAKKPGRKPARKAIASKAGARKATASKSTAKAPAKKAPAKRTTAKKTAPAKTTQSAQTTPAASAQATPAAASEQA